MELNKELRMTYKQAAVYLKNCMFWHKVNLIVMYKQCMYTSIYMKSEVSIDNKLTILLLFLVFTGKFT